MISCSTAETPATPSRSFDRVAAVLHARVEQVRERRGEKGKGGEAVDVVEHDLVVEHDRPDKAHLEAKPRPDLGGAEVGQLALGNGVEAHRE